ncbi:MAG: RDD family protein [Candidatus Lambdaproteobacteria bacterium]|nr:RDD family protein [Candidatus Lambdaproteobacteria bacterium]
MQPVPYGYASFQQRAIAFLIDVALIALAYRVGSWLVGEFISIPGNSPKAYRPEYPFSAYPFSVQFSVVMGQLLKPLCGLGLAWVFVAPMESSTRKATLGKMCMKLTVTDLTGNRISLGRASSRFFAKLLSALIFGIGFLVVQATENRQALHDIMAGTLVIRRN